MIVTERWMFKPPCARMRATWPNGGWGCIVLAVICWAPSAQGALLPDRALYLPTFSHFLIVNKTSLPPPPPTHSSYLLSLSLLLSLLLYFVTLRGLWRRERAQVKCSLTISS